MAKNRETYSKTFLSALKFVKKWRKIEHYAHSFLGLKFVISVVRKQKLRDSSETFHIQNILESNDRIYNRVWLRIVSCCVVFCCVVLYCIVLIVLV